MVPGEHSAPAGMSTLFQATVIALCREPLTPPVRFPVPQRKTPGGPFFEVARQLIQVDKPVIAAIHGPAVGAGLAYSLACDRRFGDTTTKMAAIFTKIGVAPDCGMSYFLPKVVGLPNALMMVETAQVFKAEQCKELGLLDELVEEGKAYDEALAYAQVVGRSRQCRC